MIDFRFKYGLEILLGLTLLCSCNRYSVNDFLIRWEKKKIKHAWQEASLNPGYYVGLGFYNDFNKEAAIDTARINAEFNLYPVIGLFVETWSSYEVLQQSGTNNEKFDNYSLQESNVIYKSEPVFKEIDVIKYQGKFYVASLTMIRRDDVELVNVPLIKSKQRKDIEAKINPDFLKKLKSVYKDEY